MKIVTLVAATLAVVLAIVGLCVKRVAVSTLVADELKGSKTGDVEFARLSDDLKAASKWGLPIRLWVNGELAQESASVDELMVGTEPKYRVKGGVMIYVNKSLKDKIAAGPVVLAADLQGKVFNWSRLAFASTALLAIFWLLRRFRSAGPALSLSGQGRLVTLDSLRGIAALIVMFVHAAGMFLPGSWLFDVAPSPGFEEAPSIAHYIRNTPLAIFLNGSLMVHLFWVMSGLVLSVPILRSESNQQIARSAAKRYFRLLPLAFVTTFASFFLHVVSWYPVAEFNAGTGFGVAMLAPAGKTGLSLVTAIQDALLFGSGYNMPLWTIKYEFLGSLFLFGLLACTMPLKRRRLVWGACFIFLALPSEAFYLADFIAGLLLAEFLVKSKTVSPLGKGTSMALAAVALALGSANPGWLTPLVGPISANWDAVFRLLPAGMFIVLALRSDLVGSFLRLRPLVWLGERSFALYVVHALTIHFVGHGVAVLCLRQGLPPFVSSGIGFIAFLGFTLWISDWLTKWVDVPSTSFANFVGRWISGEPAGSESKSRAVNDTSGKVRTDTIAPQGVDPEPPAQVCS